MVCIYCSGLTRVTNSRPQKRVNQIWRRRVCLNCANIFSSTEVVDLTGTVVVKSKSDLEPFSRDKLLLSIYSACGHRKDAVTASSALTATVISKLMPMINSATLNRDDVVRVVTEVLKRFDKAASVQYKAYHPLEKSRAES